MVVILFNKVVDTVRIKQYSIGIGDVNMYQDIIKDAMQAEKAREQALKEFEKMLDNVVNKQ